jgi:hypothetical protein
LESLEGDIASNATTKDTKDTKKKTAGEEEKGLAVLLQCFLGVLCVLGGSTQKNATTKDTKNTKKKTPGDEREGPGGASPMFSWCSLCPWWFRAKKVGAGSRRISA